VAAGEHKDCTLKPGRFLVVLLSLLSVYVVAELTPSSYSISLQSLGTAPKWASVGVPRMIRADEWAVWTPFVQATVRNGFQRYNATSVYNEDLRNINSLPILDWGLVFKPYFWLFFVAPPSYAYSFFFAFQVFCFLYGYRQLFRRLQLSDGLAAGGALLLVFCGFTQYWWTTLGPTLSFFPWVALSVLQSHRWWKYPAITYSVVAWVVGLAYPPAIISLCFVLLILRVSLPNHSRLRYGLLTAGSLALAGLLIGMYYQELIEITRHTIYPGARRSSPGTESPTLFMGMLWPSFNQQGFEALGGLNLCESSVIGTFLPLSLLAFIDFNELRRLFRGELGTMPRRCAVSLLIGFLLMAAWIFLPIPSVLGKIFLWQFVPARRMLFAPGFLLTALCLVILNWCRPVMSTVRTALLFMVVVAGIFVSKALYHLEFSTTPLREWVAAAIIPAGAFLVRRQRVPARRMIICMCIFANVVLFGFFNPLQSARDIFEAHESETLQKLRRLQDADSRGWLVVGEYHGAILNGQGFRSIQHVLISPHLAFFRQRFPDLPESEFNTIFNRYAHILLADVAAPYNPTPDRVVVPIDAFKHGLH
jgi:hypothetical protein